MSKTAQLKRTLVIEGMRDGLIGNPNRYYTVKRKNSKDFKLKRAFYTMGWREGTSRYFKKQTVVPILDTVEEL